MSAVTKPGQWWDRSWNPIEGCEPCSPACDHCWARAMLKRWGRDPSALRLCYERINDPLHRKKPTKYFVGSLTDLFQDRVEEQAWKNILGVVRDCPQHTFMFLTKRPQNIAKKLCPFVDITDIDVLYPNLWLGATAWDQESYNRACVYLQPLPVSVAFINLEPLLGPVDITEHIYRPDWIIVGGETGPGAREMRPEWAFSIYHSCLHHDIPMWLKAWGSKNIVKDVSRSWRRFPKGAPHA